MPDYVRMKPARNSDSTLFYAAIGGCIVALFLIFYGVFVSGWVLTILWAWFVVSAFKVPALSLPMAIGLSAIVRLLTYSDTSDLQKKELSSEEKQGRLIGSLLAPWVVLLLGWIIHFFV